jgi:hypothetical protein
MIQNVGTSWHAYVYQRLVHAEMLHKLVMFEAGQLAEDCGSLRHGTECCLEIEAADCDTGVIVSDSYNSLHGN